MVDKTFILKNNSEEIRKKITDAGINVCFCASFDGADWLDFSTAVNNGVHGVGYPDVGMTKEETLSQFAADASGRYVSAGPVEATAAGNIAMQAIAAGEIGDIWQAREVIRNSFEVREYSPEKSAKDAWDDAYGRFLALPGKVEIV